MAEKTKTKSEFETSVGKGGAARLMADAVASATVIAEKNLAYQSSNSISLEEHRDVLHTAAEAFHLRFINRQKENNTEDIEEADDLPFDEKIVAKMRALEGGENS